MKTFLQFHESALTPSDLKDVEKFADRLFAKLNIDVEFTKHFADRANDPRNHKQINPAELVRLFKKTSRAHGKQIAQQKGGFEAVLNDIVTDLNLPFVLQWDAKNHELDLIAKTIMRKKDFKTSDKKYQVESRTPLI